MEIFKKRKKMDFFSSFINRGCDFENPVLEKCGYKYTKSIRNFRGVLQKMSSTGNIFRRFEPSFPMEILRGMHDKIGFPQEIFYPLLYFLWKLEIYLIL